MENNVFQNAKTRRENPYKTLLKLMIPEPFLKNDPQNIKKGLPREGFRTAFSKPRKTL